MRKKRRDAMASGAFFDIFDSFDSWIVSFPEPASAGRDGTV